MHTHSDPRHRSPNQTITPPPPPHRCRCSLHGHENASFGDPDLTAALLHALAWGDSARLRRLDFHFAKNGNGIARDGELMESFAWMLERRSELGCAPLELPMAWPLMVSNDDEDLGPRVYKAVLAGTLLGVCVCVHAGLVWGFQAAYRCLGVSKNALFPLLPQASST